ncbi:MAG: outer membrane protein assembly factor BamA [Gemmatimonadetes bacterium]|nr:MAG: outer membrane protein assembly factor BamA [Gemmatimonadota bacterium]
MKYWQLLMVTFVATLILGGLNRTLADPIASLEVKGNTNVDELYILTISGLKVGEEFRLEAIQDAIRKLYERGQFNDIQVDQELDLDGVHLTITVEEHPLLGDVTLKGNKKIGNGDIYSKFTLLKGQPLSPLELHNSRRNILELYKEKGYLLAKVDYEMGEPDEQGRTPLTINITEGKKVKIETIQFEGNLAFSDKKLRKQFEDTKETRWYQSHYLDETQLESDLERLVDFYRRMGYINARVVGHTIGYDEDLAHMTITVTVEEGERFYFGEVDWDGNELFTKSQLQMVTQYKTGEIFDQKRFEETIQKYYEIYSDKGHIFASIIPDERVEGRVIHVTYRIDEGEPARVRNVVITGNTKTYEKVIRREINILPGEIFDRSKVIRSQRDILYLNFFDETQFQFDLQPVNTVGPGGGESEVDLFFGVAEKRTGTISAGAGYSSQDRVTGFLELAENNLFGRSQRLNLRWQFGRTRQDVEFGFTEPWLWDTPTSAGFDIFRTLRDYGDYDRITTGFALRAGRPFPWLDYSSIYGQFRLEDVEIDVEEGYTPPETGTNLFDYEGKRRSNSFRLTLSRDSRNDTYQPSRGSRTSLTAEYAGGPLGGDVKYQKYLFNTGWYSELPWKWSLGIDGKFGYINGLKSADEVPVYERFELGGVLGNRLRGYPDYSLVPEGNEYREGGRVMSIFSAETRYTVAPSQLYLVGFAEAGYTWNDLVDVDFGTLKRSLGFGIRIITPMGPLGFDYAYGLDDYWDGIRYQSGGKWEPHFIFGTAF